MKASTPGLRNDGCNERTDATRRLSDTAKATMGSRRATIGLAGAAAGRMVVEEGVVGGPESEKRNNAGTADAHIPLAAGFWR